MIVSRPMFAILGLLGPLCFNRMDWDSILVDSETKFDIDFDSSKFKQILNSSSSLRAVDRNEQAAYSEHHEQL